jgi:hypothetical protein
MGRRGPMPSFIAVTVSGMAFLFPHLPFSSFIFLLPYFFFCSLLFLDIVGNGQIDKYGNIHMGDGNIAVKQVNRTI